MGKIIHRSLNWHKHLVGKFDIREFYNIFSEQFYILLSQPVFMTFPHYRTTTNHQAVLLKDEQKVYISFIGFQNKYSMSIFICFKQKPHKPTYENNIFS